MVPPIFTLYFIKMMIVQQLPGTPPLQREHIHFLENNYYVENLYREITDLPLVVFAEERSNFNQINHFSLDSLSEMERRKVKEEYHKKKEIPLEKGTYHLANPFQSVVFSISTKGKWEGILTCREKNNQELVTEKVFQNNQVVYAEQKNTASGHLFWDFYKKNGVETLTIYADDSAKLFSKIMQKRKTLCYVFYNDNKVQTTLDLANMKQTDAEENGNEKVSKLKLEFWNERILWMEKGIANCIQQPTHLLQQVAMMKIDNNFLKLDDAVYLEMNDATSEEPIQLKRFLHYQKLIDLKDGKYAHLGKEELKKKKEIWRQTEDYQLKKGMYAIDNALQKAYFEIDAKGELHGEIVYLSKNQPDTWCHFFYINGNCKGGEMRTLAGITTYKKEITLEGHSITLWDTNTGVILTKENYKYSFSKKEPASTGYYDENGNLISIYDAIKKEKIIAAPPSE